MHSRSDAPSSNPTHCIPNCYFSLKNWRHFDFYEHSIKKFHIRQVKCLVRGGCQFGRWNQVTTGKLVAFVCSTWRAVLKIFASLILIQQVNTSKSLQQELFTSWKEKTKARETCSWRLENALTVTNLRNSCHLATSWQQFWNCLQDNSPLNLY